MTKTTFKRARAAMVLLFAMLTAMTVGAADVVTIGNASGGSDMPLSASHSYVLTQQIITAEQINHAKGKIWSIAFNVESGDLTRNLDIYITTTDQTWLSSSEWQAVTAADCMFSGEVTFATGKWVTIYFDNPYEYDGTSNLLITIDDNTGESSGNWGVLSCHTFSGNHIYAYSEKNDLDPKNLATLDKASYKSSVSYQNQVQLTFGDYPTPANLSVTDIGDVSALVQCSLRGDATAWNMRYRKAGTEAWNTQNGLTDRSKTIEDLTAATKYEVQVQSVFQENKQSDWTESLEFSTACCPVEQQAEIFYAMNSNYSNYYGFAVQFIDITDESKPVEVAYINPPGYGLYGGSLTLCCGHQYKVNWIYDANHANVIDSYSLALYFEPGDLFYSMPRGTAPARTAELTTFVMDCTPYCAQKPQNLTVAGTTFESATITFVSQTQAGEVVYSTNAGFDPDTATPTSISFDALAASDNPWGGTPDNSSLTLTGLEPLTEYYVQVRSVCIDELTGKPEGKSRWSEPVKVTTGSRYDAPTQVTAEPINSRTENLSWGGRGSEKSFNLYYRKYTTGEAVDMSAIETFGGGKGTGFESGNWGKDIWSSYGDRPFSNTLFVGNVPAGSSFGFKAGNGKTGAGMVKFLYGMQKLKKDGTPLEQMKKFDKKCLNDADRAYAIEQLKNKKNELIQQLIELESAHEKGDISDNEYNQQKKALDEEIAAIEAELEDLNSLPTDAQKLEQMRTLEKNIEDNVAALDALALKNANGEITDEEFKSQSDVLKAQNALYGAELSELRAITTNAENPQKDGFSITNDGQSAAQTRGFRSPEDETYVFFIRHSDPNGVLLVKDITITPPDQQGAWICIPGLTETAYMLSGLEPNTTYEVKVEPVYDNGITGTQSPITVFTTLGTETEPTEGVFSVAQDKKVQFAHGNLRYNGDIYEGTWSMAKQQYEVFGQDNVEVVGSHSYPASPTDLFCWSTTNNHYGVSNYYYYDDEDAQPYFMGDFTDWGLNPTLISDLGAGWSTLSKDEWSYLLSQRPNAASLKATAKVNGVKGLVILPDAWTAPAGAPVLSGSFAEITLAQWTLMEQAGAVFLPAAGQLTTTYEDYNAVTTLTEAATYWTSSPSDDASGLKAMPLTIGNTGATLNTDLHRRTATAVRLVKALAPEQELQDEWIMAIDDQDCTGSELKPALTVKNGNYPLSEGTDYTATYNNNVNVGTAKVTITAVEGSGYTGTASATFNIVRDMSMVFSAGNSWATYVAQENLTTPDGLTAYTVGNVTTTTVTALPVSYIPAGVGILLNRSNAGITAYKGTAYTGTPANIASRLVGSATATTSVTPYKDFVLFRDEFVLTNAKTIPAGHAYLPATATPSGARTLAIDIDGVTTAIDNSQTSNLNSQANEWYDLSGRKLYGQPTEKGAYLHNGKVTIIK